MDYNILLSKRLKIILDRYYQGNFSAMAKDIGVTDTGIGSYIRGKKDKNGNIRISTPSAEVIASIVNNLGINSEWLLFGTGEMLKSDIKSSPEIIQYESKEDYGGKGQVKDLMELVKSQQETIRSQSRSIEILSSKGGNDTAGGAPSARAK